MEKDRETGSLRPSLPIPIDQPRPRLRGKGNQEQRGFCRRGAFEGWLGLETTKPRLVVRPSGELGAAGQLEARSGRPDGFPWPLTLFLSNSF